MPKIYIIGPVGSGKTTLAKRISQELSIPYYELDNITWQKNKTGPDTKRSDQEIKKLFKDIINKDNWIIENTGKEIYSEAYAYADSIIYINLDNFTLYTRIITRWFKQKLKIVYSPYPPTLTILKQMLAWAKAEKENPRILKLSKYNNKIIILNKKQLNNFKYNETKKL